MIFEGENQRATVSRYGGLRKRRGVVQVRKAKGRGWWSRPSSFEDILRSSVVGIDAMAALVAR